MDYTDKSSEMLSQSIVRNYKYCKEYMDEYRARKREIHYLQHDVDTKEKEIERLKTTMEEERKQIMDDQASIKADAQKLSLIHI